MKRKRLSKEFKAKVVLEALKGQRTAIELAQEFGVHINQINLWKKQLIENAAWLFERREAKKEKEREKERERLYQKVGQLQVEVDWLKKNDRVSQRSVAEKRARIEPDHPELSVSRQCELLGLSRVSYYRQPKQETAKNLELMRRIDEIYTAHPFYGSRKIRDHLRRMGYKVNRKRVQRLMGEMGLVAVAPKRKTTISNPSQKIYLYLLWRSFS